MTHPDATVEASRAAARRAGKAAAPQPDATPTHPRQTRRGVGTHLKLILNALGLGESASCGCESMRARMDAWGPAGCRANREPIEAHLRTEARKVGWVATLKAGARAASAGLILNPLDPAPGLLAEAIRRAETAPPLPPLSSLPPGPPPPPPTKADPWAAPVVVPEPPPFTGRVTSSRCLVTVAANDKGRRLLEVSGPLMERYARRIGADFHVLDWPGPPTWPMGSKFALGPVVAAYDRTIYADADVLFRPGCVNLFEQVPPDTVGGVSDWWAVARTYPPFHEEYRRFLAFMGFDPVDPVPWYLNTGLLILPRSVAPLLAPPAAPIPPLWCSEQHWWNARIHAAGVPVHILPPRCNFQWWAYEPEFWQTAPRKPGGFAPPADAVLHFSGPTDTERKLKLMREWAPELPPEPEPEPIPEPVELPSKPESAPEPEPAPPPPREFPPSDGPAPCGPPPAARFALRRGLTREVLILGDWVVKLPSFRGWRPFLSGLMANLTERARSGLDPRLCPVRFAAPGGFLSIQRRARPLTPAAADAITPEFGQLPTGGPWPRVPPPDLDPADPLSWRNFGELDGRPVIVDYG